MQVTFTFFSRDGFSIVVVAVWVLAGQYTASAAARKIVLDTPMVNTVVAGYSFVDNAMTAS